MTAIAPCSACQQDEFPNNMGLRSDVLHLRNARVLRNDASPPWAESHRELEYANWNRIGGQNENV